MIEAKSYRSVPMVPTGAMRAAAAYVDREWGEDGYRLGFAGETVEGQGRASKRVYVFQVCACDGSRFLVWSDRYGNVGAFLPELEKLIASQLDVEVSV